MAPSKGLVSRRTKLLENGVNIQWRSRTLGNGNLFAFHELFLVLDWFTDLIVDLVFFEATHVTRYILTELTILWISLYNYCTNSTYTYCAYVYWYYTINKQIESICFVGFRLQTEYDKKSNKSHAWSINLANKRWEMYQQQVQYVDLAVWTILLSS